MITRKRWEAGANPVEMLESMWQRVTDRGRHPERDRKVRLYYAGLARQYWDELPWIGRVTTELAERMADDAPERVALREPLEYIAEGIWLYFEFGERRLKCPPVLSPIRSHHPILEHYLAELTGIERPTDGPDWPVTADYDRCQDLAGLLYIVHRERPSFFPLPASIHSVPLLRDIFGNPFRPVAFAESWRSESAVALARAMYESRNFSPMPVLADALEEAGCDHAEVLSHCRRPDGGHARGCWVVDGVLGKT